MWWFVDVNFNFFFPLLNWICNFRRLSFGVMLFFIKFFHFTLSSLKLFMHWKSVEMLVYSGERYASIPPKPTGGMNKTKQNSHAIEKPKWMNTNNTHSWRSKRKYTIFFSLKKWAILREGFNVGCCCCCVVKFYDSWLQMVVINTNGM